MNPTTHISFPTGVNEPHSRATSGEESVEIDDRGDLARALIASRQNVSPKRLGDPGPRHEQIERILAGAAAAPDHGQLTPWRFVIVPKGKRTILAEAFALALTDRDPGANLIQIEAAREKAHRAPFLMLAVARLASSDASSDIPDAERVARLRDPEHPAAGPCHGLWQQPDQRKSNGVTTAPRAIPARLRRNARLLCEHRHSFNAQTGAHPAGSQGFRFETVEVLRLVQSESAGGAELYSGQLFATNRPMRAT